MQYIKKFQKFSILQVLLENFNETNYKYAFCVTIIRQATYKGAMIGFITSNNILAYTHNKCMQSSLNKLLQT